MELEIRYCTTEDGVRIAYWVRGSGEPIVWQSLFLAQMSSEPEDYARWFSQYFSAKGRMIIRFDGRGIGLSQRNLDDFSLDARVRDLDAVAKAMRLKAFDLVGDMWSGPVAVAYSVRFPRRVRHLVLFRTYARAADITSRERWQPLVELARTNWRMAAEIFATIDNPDRRTEGSRMASDQLLTEGVEGEDAAKWLAQQYDVDVSELLGRLNTPTLVMHSREERSVRFKLGRDLAVQIPGALFVELRGRGRDMWQEMVRKSAAFVNEGSFLPEDRADSAFRTVLFTDLVGHTEMMSRLGDEMGRAVLREHETITRNVLKQHGGTEVKTMGDGFMASFGSVTKAVECAIALQRAFAERNSSSHPEAIEGLSVRVGLNAGEPIEEDGDLFGATVILASRIAAKAEGGEILVADTVRGLCSGKGFLFADRGEFVAKGFEEPVRVYEVRWRDG